jgi:hypothetical protein
MQTLFSPLLFPSMDAQLKGKKKSSEKTFTMINLAYLQQKKNVYGHRKHRDNKKNKKKKKKNIHEKKVLHVIIKHPN